MVDTARSVSSLQSILGDNTTGDISPQDLRDFLVTSLGVYGSISAFDASTAQGSLGTTPVKLTGFTTNGKSKGVTPDHTNDQLTITVAGDYCVEFQCSFSGTSSAEAQFRLRVDGVEQSFGCNRKLGTGGDVGSCFFVAPDITLANTDVLTIYVETDSGAGTDSITVVDAQFSARLIG